MLNLAIHGILEILIIIIIVNKLKEIYKMRKFIRKLGYIYGGVLISVFLLGCLYQIVFYSYINQRVELLKQAAEQIEVVQKYEHSEMKVKGYLQIEKKISFIVHTNDSPDIILNELNKQFERMGWTISKVDRNYYGFRAYNDNYGFIAGPIMKKSKITGKEEFENDWLVIFYYNNFFARSNI